MKEEVSEKESQVDKVSSLNAIFENLVSDASNLIKDLYWGVKNYLLFGLISFLFGVQTILYNMDSLQSQLYIPVFVGGAMIFSGSVQILNYFRLNSKYSRLFKTQNELKKT
jgi:uncharacterized membrane protein HdeD (DUF308 family)